MTQFLAISGRKQSGKDTVARYLQGKLYQDFNGYRSAITHFAEPLKNMIHDVFGVPSQLLYGTDEDKNTLTDIHWDNLPMNIRVAYSVSLDIEGHTTGDIPVFIPKSGAMTIREVLQVIGTDIFRNMIDYDVWAKSIFRKNWGNIDLVIIPDCRFENEVKQVKDHGGFVMRINRNTGLTDTHLSETALDNYMFDSVIDNNGDLSELYYKAYSEAVRLLRLNG